MDEQALKPGQQYEPGAALCLSGGGYRAMLFHLGGIIRLNDLGWLPKIRHVAGVSGGAILAGWLGLKWHKLKFEAGNASNLSAEVVEPIMSLASKPLDIAAGLAGMFVQASVLAKGLDNQLFKGAMLADLPEGEPMISLCTTNLLTGGYTLFSARGVDEEYLGFHETSGLALASAVAASCSIPPTFRPFRLGLEPQGWQGVCEGRFRHVRQAKVALRLCDGGNHDNLGLKAVWDRYGTLLVSDGSSPMPPWTWISGNWLAVTLRSNRILIDQLRVEKKRVLIKTKLGNPECRQDGAYWGISSSPDAYELADAMVRDSRLTDRLANLRTRLGRHTEEERCLLVNFGYAMADTAMRKHVLPGDVPAGSLPYPQFPLQA